VDAVVRVTEEPIDHDEIMVGLVMTRGEVVLVESLLCEHRKQQAHTCAHGDGKDCVKHVVLSHGSQRRVVVDLGMILLASLMRPTETKASIFSLL